MEGLYGSLATSLSLGLETMIPRTYYLSFQTQVVELIKDLFTLSLISLLHAVLEGQILLKKKFSKKNLIYLKSDLTRYLSYVLPVYLGHGIRKYSHGYLRQNIQTPSSDI